MGHPDSTPPISPRYRDGEIVHRLARRMGPLVGIVSVLISLAFPAIFLIYASGGQTRRAETSAREIAQRLDTLSEEPHLWGYQTPLFTDAVRQATSTTPIGKILVRTPTGDAIRSFSYAADTGPLATFLGYYTGSAPLVINGEIVAQVLVGIPRTAGLQLILACVLVGLVVSSGLAWVAYYTPIRVVRGIEQDKIALQTRDIAQQRRLEAVRAFTSEVAQSLDVAPVLRRITDQAQELLDASCGALWLWNEDTARLVRYAVDSEPGQAPTTFRLGEGLAGQVGSQRVGMALNAYPDTQARDFDPRLAGQVCAAIAEPLLHKDRLLGVLAVGTDTPPAAVQRRRQPDPLPVHHAGVNRHRQGAAPRVCRPTRVGTGSAPECHRVGALRHRSGVDPDPDRRRRGPHRRRAACQGRPDRSAAPVSPGAGRQGHHQSGGRRAPAGQRHVRPGRANR